MKRINLLAALLFSGAVIMSACNGNNSTTTSSDSTATSSMSADTSHNMSAMNSDTSHNAMSANVDEDTKAFMNKAAEGGMMEVALGNDAVNKASDPEVKNFGKMMVDDHTAANDKLKAIAANKNVTLPSSVSADMQHEMDELNKKSGKDFDKAYVKMMVDDHKKDVDEFKKAAGSLKDADVSKFASETLPTLQKHLDAIEKINKKM